MTSHDLEHWETDAGNGDVARLDIPTALRTREFLIDVRFVVRCPSGNDDAKAWHSLSVEFGRRQEWSRRIPTSNPGQTDSLDYQRQVEVPVGEGLRIVARARAHLTEPLRLRIEATEQAR